MFSLPGARGNPRSSSLGAREERRESLRTGRAAGKGRLAALRALGGLHGADVAGRALQRRAWAPAKLHPAVHTAHPALPCFALALLTLFTPLALPPLPTPPTLPLWICLSLLRYL